MKYIWIATYLFLTQQPIYAQQMKMDHQMSSPARKSIFLSMMDTMMVKMDNQPAGNSAEAIFMLQMIPHHEGAIEMAKYEIEYGNNFAMKQLAKSILAEQNIEVQQMKLWLKKSELEPASATASFLKDMKQAMNIMMQNMPADNSLTGLDQAFACVMKPHHQAAIDMARVMIKFSRDEQTIAFAKHIISSQQIEIEQMSSFLK